MAIFGGDGLGICQGGILSWPEVHAAKSWSPQSSCRWISSTNPLGVNPWPRVKVRASAV